MSTRCLNLVLGVCEHPLTKSSIIRAAHCVPVSFRTLQFALVEVDLPRGEEVAVCKMLQGLAFLEPLQSERLALHPTKLWSVKH